MNSKAFILNYFTFQFHGSLSAFKSRFCIHSLQKHFINALHFWRWRSQISSTLYWTTYSDTPNRPQIRQARLVVSKVLPLDYAGLSGDAIYLAPSIPHYCYKILSAQHFNCFYFINFSSLVLRRLSCSQKCNFIQNHKRLLISQVAACSIRWPWNTCKSIPPHQFKCLYPME